MISNTIPMKVKILLIIFIICNFFCLGQEKTNDWNRYSLEGKVKIVQEISYKAELYNGEIVKGNLDLRNEEQLDIGSNALDYLAFNRAGMLTENKSSYPNGQVRMHHKYHYDYSGKMIGDRYNEYGLLMTPNSDFEVFDELGRSVMHGYKISPTDVDFKTTKFFYNKNDEWIKKEEYYGNKLNVTSTYIYDLNGNIIKEETFPSDDGRDGIHTINYENKYDSNEDLIEKKAIMEQSLWYIERFNYDQKHIVLKELRYDKNGILETVYVYKWDISGNKLETSIFSYSDSSEYEKKTDYKYAHDKLGNWVKRIEYVNNKPTFILERHITYFE